MIIKLHEFDRWFVRLGEYDVTTTTDGRHEDILVRQWRKHAQYEQNLLLNDIGIILLQHDVIFNGKLKSQLTSHLQSLYIVSYFFVYSNIFQNAYTRSACL